MRTVQCNHADTMQQKADTYQSKSLLSVSVQSILWVCEGHSGDPRQTPILKADPQIATENEQMSLWKYLEYTRSRLSPGDKIKDGPASHFSAPSGPKIWAWVTHGRPWVDPNRLGTDAIFFKSRFQPDPGYLILIHRFKNCLATFLILTKQKDHEMKHHIHHTPSTIEWCRNPFAYMTILIKIIKHFKYLDYSSSTCYLYWYLSRIDIITFFSKAIYS